MTDIKNVIIVGATGNVGPIFVETLKKQFNITVLSRPGGSRSSLPPNTRVVEADYDSIVSLADALRGNDAVLSLVNGAATVWQEKLIEAAIQAGVERFIPSEFGANTENELCGALPVYAGRKQIQNYLKSRADEISYDVVITGAFLDFGIKIGLILTDLKNKKFTIYDDGKTQINATTTQTVANAVSAILRRPASNGFVKTRSVTVDQLELLEAAKEAVGSEGWEITYKKSAELQEQWEQAAKDGVTDFFVAVVPQLVGSIYLPGYGAVYEDDNEALGLPYLDKKEVVDVIKGVAKELGI